MVKVPTQEAESLASETPTKGNTNWLAFEKAMVMPREIWCMGYRPVHFMDFGCHSRLLLDASSILSHSNSEHGRGFQLRLRKTDKPWAGWKKFVELGLESSDLRCEICDKQVPFHPLHISNHMRSHSGKSRRVTPGGVFNLTIAGGSEVAPDENESFSELG